MQIPQLLVFAVGNPSRGDDALGPLFVERAESELAREVAAGTLEFQTDFQLQIEHALDLAGRRRVIFVDASLNAAPPFSFEPTAPRRDATHSSHAMSPEAVLDTFRDVSGEPPPAWVLAIRGERFELGDALSPVAHAHLDAAVDFFVGYVRRLENASNAMEAKRIEIEGTVQGVGFRPWVYRQARAHGLVGRVFNGARGVVIEAQGTTAALDALMNALRRDTPPAAVVQSIRTAAMPASDARTFVIDASDPVGETRLTVPADLAVCEDCLREVDDPRDRHHGYVFTSCTHCGPRFSIVTALPYDRSRTTMARFEPCAACAREYTNPDDRRFHAQTVACPACGPRLWLADAAGSELPTTDVIGSLAALLLEGRIAAIQGLGAFHLACDATSEDAVSALRHRKRRDDKPFAVMVRDLAGAEAIAMLDEEARVALTSPARPIVLLPSRAEGLARGVCGPSRRVGVMLPYTPLHHLLMQRVDRPLVMTSGNLSGEPAVIHHDEALRTLGAVVDCFALHDRGIVRRVEDSVVALMPGGPRVVRRARGFAPDPVRLRVASPEPVLAVGGHLKNTVCVVVEDRAYLSPHLGDLESVESERAWRSDLDAFEQLLGVRANVLAHDLHPEYATTRFACERPARVRIGVQHHVAHILAVVAEHRIDEPVVGVAFDGTGWGPDGTAWGAEILLVDGTQWTRFGTFRPVPLPGGERAIREVWRAAYGALRDAYGDEALDLTARLSLFRDLPISTLRPLARMVSTGVQTTRARGIGRWFDVVGALALNLPRAGFEGHVAMALEECSSQKSGVRPYPFELTRQGELLEVDLRPAVRAIVDEVLAKTAVGTIAARFHATIVEAAALLVEQTLERSAARRVVLTGGSFQNRTLERDTVARVGADRVTIARNVPVNDGGIALGQAMAAVLVLTERNVRAAREG